jgi:hypothetical protein
MDSKMNKFSKLVEKVENKKYFEVMKVKLDIEAIQY